MKRFVLLKASQLLKWLSTKEKACNITGKIVLTFLAYGLKRKGESL